MLLLSNRWTVRVKPYKQRDSIDPLRLVLQANERWKSIDEKCRLRMRQGLSNLHVQERGQVRAGVQTTARRNVRTYVHAQSNSYE